MSRACTFGSSFSPDRIWPAPLSKISLAVIEFPRAMLGSDTLNRPTRKSETRRAVAASVLALLSAARASSSARFARTSPTVVPAMPKIIAATAMVAATTPTRCRRTNFFIL
jgi:hypothetical protein